MGTVSFFGLRCDDDGAPDAAALSTLAGRERVVVLAADASRAASLIASLDRAGIACRSAAELGVVPSAPLASAVHALAALAEEGDLVVVFPAAERVSRETFEELVEIIARLRSPAGCPWDREQTHATLGKHLIEEAYETLAAIEAGDDAALADELGDVLLQVVLHAQIGAEEGAFTIDDVVGSIVRKIRRRHPHVFGDASVDSSAEVMRNWDAIKRGEKAAGVLGEVPHALPALMLAQKISRRAASAGFDWEDVSGVWDKVHEEIDELKAAQPGSADAAAEVGDLLFTVVNVARKLGVDAESALRGTCAKFVRRFRDMEEASAERGHALDELDLAAWEELWQQAKRKEAAADDTET